VRYSLILSLLLAVPCLSQTTTTGGAETKGPCSPAVTGSNNNFAIECGIGKEQGHKMLAILNKILANQLDPEAVMTKLDEIQTGVSSIKGELESKKEQEEEAERKRRTAPLLAVSLVPIAVGKVNLCINSKNLIPYEFRYFIVDSKNTVLGGFPLSMETVYPTSGNELYCIPKDIDLTSIPDRYIELRFTFKSLSYDELHLPGHGGEAILKYKIAPDGKSIVLIP